MSLAFKVCPKCGCRNAVRPGSAYGDWCAGCSPGPAPGWGFHVQVHGLQKTEDGPVVHWRLRVVDPKGEVILSLEPLEQEKARALALAASENIIKFLEAHGA